jgi:TorA maturation chaperone TorD
MRLWVSADGHIDAVQVLSAEPEVPWLESLLQNITQTPLRPAYEQGRAVASSWLVEWQLDLSGGL